MPEVLLFAVLDVYRLDDWPGSAPAASIAVLFFLYCRLLRMTRSKNRSIAAKYVREMWVVEAEKCKGLTPSRLPSAWYLVISKFPQVLVHDRSD